jgi:hypothetical protein
MVLAVGCILTAIAFNTVLALKCEYDKTRRFACDLLTNRFSWAL